MGRLLAIIPARGGSKGIPGKNLKPLAGYPLIQWTLEVVKRAGITAYVTTDDARIAELAENYCEVIHRPRHLARDLTWDLPVAQHALDHIGWKPTDKVLWLRPTSPFRRPEELVAVTGLLPGRADSVRSIRRVRDHPQKCYVATRLGPLTRIVPATKDHRANAPRQQLWPAYAATGFIDVFWASLPMREETMEGEIIRGWLSPEERSIDLDTEEDWAAAERLAMERDWRPGEVR